MSPFHPTRRSRPARARRKAAKRAARRLLGLAALWALSWAGCVSTTGRLERNRFQHETYPYALFYAENGKPRSPLGPYWSLSNFRSPDGRHLYAKRGPGYTVRRKYDRDTHGSANPARDELFYDVLLTRTEPANQAAMWVRTVPLARAEAGVPLATLADRYLTQAQKTGRVAAPFGLELAGAAPGGATLTRRGQTACELSKREALRVDFLLEKPGGSAPKRGSVVLVRTGYAAHDAYPVIMLIGRSATAETEAIEPDLERDFDRLLEKVVLGDAGQGLSMKGGHTCGLTESAGGEAGPIPASGAPAPAREPAEAQADDPMLQLQTDPGDDPAPVGDDTPSQDGEAAPYDLSDEPGMAPSYEGGDGFDELEYETQAAEAGD